ncbi:hypothetical protein BBG47_05980 [Paenibacillus sp. KS1]|uniref:hypothetical protein n=1 Tax=Paenibacillus sp. KS1 TaxID=1849249 RepID=UPI0008064AE2|nr:hypothetical protein [Paenibacillus sp. KS1]OBY80562.1 hypothetical protein BBG47_05980 [Paenibacillus sp. KS1]
MSRYKMPIMIVALLLISGVLGNHVYQTRITYSLHDLVMDYVNEAKIESIFLKKFMSGDNEGNNYAHITDNKQIELVMSTLQDILVRNDFSASNFPEYPAYLLSFYGEKGDMVSYIMSEGGEILLHGYADSSNKSYRTIDDARQKQLKLLNQWLVEKSDGTS